MERMSATELFIAAAVAKRDRGEPLDREEFQAVYFDLAKRAAAEVLEGMEEVRNKNDSPVLYSQGAHNATRTAVKLIMAQMFAVFAGHSEKRQRIEGDVAKLQNYLTLVEQRLAALESTSKSAKPRHRVAAGSRPAA